MPAHILASKQSGYYQDVVLGDHPGPRFWRISEAMCTDQQLIIISK